MKKELLHQFFEGTTTPEEEQEIKKWTDASTEHAEELFR
jgi:ferric-dicitrate binding protein FerR (iron transport regulator)